MKQLVFVIISSSPSIEQSAQNFKPLVLAESLHYFRFLYIYFIAGICYENQGGKKSAMGKRLWFSFAMLSTSEFSPNPFLPSKCFLTCLTVILIANSIQPFRHIAVCTSLAIIRTRGGYSIVKLNTTCETNLLPLYYMA